MSNGSSHPGNVFQTTVYKNPIKSPPILQYLSYNFQTINQQIFKQAKPIPNHFTSLLPPVKMKFQLMTLFTLFAAAMALPAASENENVNEIRQLKVCTQASQGKACEVVNVSGKIVGGICEFDPVSSPFPYCYTESNCKV